MKHLEKTAPGVTAPLSIPGTTRKSESLFACLHDVEALSGYLLRDAAAGGAPHRNSPSGPIQKLPKKKRRNIVKHFARNNRGILFPWCEVLAGKMCLMEPGLRVTELKLAVKAGLPEQRSSIPELCSSIPEPSYAWHGLGAANQVMGKRYGIYQQTEAI